MPFLHRRCRTLSGALKWLVSRLTRWLPKRGACRLLGFKPLSLGVYALTPRRLGLGPTLNLKTQRIQQMLRGRMCCCYFFCILPSLVRECSRVGARVVTMDPRCPDALHMFWESLRIILIGVLPNCLYSQTVTVLNIRKQDFGFLPHNFGIAFIWGVSHNSGKMFWGSHNKEYNRLGSVLGSPYLGNCHISYSPHEAGGSSTKSGACCCSLRIPRALNWVAVEEPSLSYYIGDTILLII